MNAAIKEHIQVKIADAQNDSAKQNNDVEDLIQQGVDILLINPLILMPFLRQFCFANQTGIPVITIDRSATKGNVVTFIASNNVEGGKMAPIISKLGKKQ